MIVGPTLVYLYIGLNIGVNKCLHKSVDVLMTAAFMSLLPHSFVVNSIYT
jgi:hypothetical protein